MRHAMPGPWRIEVAEEPAERAVTYLLTAANGDQLARITIGDDQPKRDQLARLLRTTPELLDALQLLLDRPDAATRRKAQAAIANACRRIAPTSDARIRGEREAANE